MLLKIVKKGVASLECTAPDGKPVTISAYKSPSVFIKGRAKNEGEEFEAGDMLTSEAGRLYSANRISVEKALFEHEKVEAERAILGLKMRVLAAQAAKEEM